MKKLIAIILCLGLCFLPTLKAEENEPVVEEKNYLDQISDELDDLAGKTVDTSIIKEVMNEVLSKYFEEDIVSTIISLTMDLIGIFSILVVFLKYSKYKHGTTEEVKRQLDTQLPDLIKNDETIKELFEKYASNTAELEKDMQTMMKVLVLMQDNTKEGKIALIDYLGDKTKEEEVSKIAEQVEDKIKEELKKQEETEEKVADDYKSIF